MPNGAATAAAAVRWGSGCNSSGAGMGSSRGSGGNAGHWEQRVQQQRQQQEWVHEQQCWEGQERRQWQ